LKNRISIFFTAGILLTGLYSCKKDAGTPFDFGYNYFPNEVGKYVVYNVDSFYYDDRYFPSKIDTFNFQLKEKIESIYSDNEGRPTIRLERYVKYKSSIPYSSMDWTLRNVWVENRSAKTAEKVEENVRFVKLSFPVKADETWNGNIYNTEGEENYKYNFIDKERTIGNIHFDSVLQVDHHDETNLVLKKYSEEKYARNVGLIFKRFIDVNSQYPESWNSSSNLNDSLAIFYGKDIMNRVSSGSQYTMTISTYGKE
jgi:hypothetical protein